MAGEGADAGASASVNADDAANCGSWRRISEVRSSTTRGSYDSRDSAPARESSPALSWLWDVARARPLSSALGVRSSFSILLLPLCFLLDFILVLFRFVSIHTLDRAAYACVYACPVNKDWSNDGVQAYREYSATGISSFSSSQAFLPACRLVLCLPR